MLTKSCEKPSISTDILRIWPAKWLYAMVVRQVETVEAIRELIGVPPDIESALQEYARQNPNEACRINRVLQFRKLVQEKFHQLTVRETSAADFPSMTHGGSTQPA